MANSSAATLEVHFKLFGTDGVSLQSQELARALRNRGWRVHSCASDVPEGAEGLRIAELSYQTEDALTLRRRVFQPAGTTAGSLTEQDLLAEIEQRASVIRARVEEYIDEHGIRVLHIRNIMSLPYNLAATLAFYQLIDERSDLFFLLQHHDLYWEGPNSRNFGTPYPKIADLIASVTCPDRMNVAHVLINPIAAQALHERRGIQGTVVPDGFDFDREVVAIDEEVFRNRLQTLSGDKSTITRDDLVVAMPARVAINKAIELAIQFVAGLETRRAELEDVPGGLGARQRHLTARNKIVLLLPQGEDLEENLDYFNRLIAYAQHLAVTLAYGGQIVVPDRKFTAGDPDHFPFYSTYQAVDLVCYPPEHEGFGNQAIETIWARLPLAVLEYPVFKAFVRDHIPHYISLGDAAGLNQLDEFGGLHQLPNEVLRHAVHQAVTVLKDHELQAHWTARNVASLRAFCGIETVSQQYIQLYHRGLKELPPPAS
jgi:mannosylglucosylglycerate synthase